MHFGSKHTISILFLATESMCQMNGGGSLSSFFQLGLSVKYACKHCHLIQPVVTLDKITSDETYSHNSKIRTCFCDYTGLFVSDLVGNRYSPEEVHFDMYQPPFNIN